MIRRKEMRKNVKKQNWMKEKEPDYSYSETHMRRNRRDYGMSSPVMERTPMRHHSEYSYNTFEDRYNGWQDKYRRDQYSIYDSLYDTDDDESYRYQSRRKYDDDYYDETEYSSYYDEDDTDYTYKKSHSESRTNNKDTEGRRAKMFDDSKYLYRYEKDHPGYRHNHSYNKKNKKHIPSETDKPRHKNDMDIYAIHDILGQKGLRYKKYNTTEPQRTSEIFSETDIESGYRGQVKRKIKPEYNIYSTQINNKTAIDKKIKIPTPERLVSVTDYQEIPVLAFKKTNKRGSPLNNTSIGGSDLVYLPVVMKEKDNKLAHQRNVKTFPRFQNSTETAEKPLEENVQVYRTMASGKNNFFKYKNNRGSKQNLNIYKSNQKGINVYTVSSGPSQFFRKSATNSKNMKNIKSNTSVQSDNLTEKMPDTGSSIVHITNTGASNEMMNIEPTDSGGSIAVPLKTRSMEEIRKSTAVPVETKKESTKRSVSKLSIDSIRDNIVARKSSVIGKTNPTNNNTFDTDMKGQNVHKSIIRQSYVPPREQSVVNERKDLTTAQKIFVSGLQRNLNNQNTPLKGIIKPSIAPQKKSVVKKSYVVDQQDLGNNSQYFGTNFSDLESEGQDLQRNQSRQSITAPKGVARQSNVLPKNPITQQTVPKSLLRQSPKKSLVRQSSAIQKGQSILDKDQVKGIEGQTTQKSMASGMLQRGQSVEARDQIMGTENQSTRKSLLGQSRVVRKGQSFEDRGLIEETELQSTQKSLSKQSTPARNSQAFADRDKTIGVEEQSTQKSMVRRSGVPKRGQSYVDRDQVMGSQGQSLVRQSNAAQRVQSFVERDQVTGIENQSTKKSMAMESSVPQRTQSFVDRDQTMETQSIKKSLARQSSAARRGQSLVDKYNSLGTKVQSTQNSVARQSSVPKRTQSFVDRDQIMEETQSIKKSLARQSSAAQRGQSFVDKYNSLGTKVQSTQKSVARQSSVPKRTQSVVDRDQIMEETQSTKKSLARQSSAAQRGQSFVDRDQTFDTEGQNTQKSFRDRDKTFYAEGQNTQKSFAKQSAARRGESNKVIGIEEQNTQKMMARQSNVDGRGQSFVVGDRIIGIEGRDTQKSKGGKSWTAQRGENFIVNEQEQEGQSTQKSMAKQISVAQRGQNLEYGRKNSFVEQHISDSNLQGIHSLGQQSQISVLGPGEVSQRDQRKSSAVRQQTITRNEQGNIEDIPRSNIKSGIGGSNLGQPQQSVGTKRPTKIKSKTLMKRAFTKLGTFTRKQGKTEKDQDSSSTAPMLDIIMSEGNMPVESQNRQSLSQQPVSNVNEPVTETSSGSIKQHTISTKPKKSTKSKLSKPLKSLLGRSKKSDLRQRQPSNIENVQPPEQSNAEAIQTKYIEQNQHSSEQSSVQYAEIGQPPTSDETYEQTDADELSSEELKPKKRIYSDQSADNFPPILKEYDLTPMLYFLQIAQYIVGVTIHDKLMEVFAVL